MKKITHFLLGAILMVIIPSALLAQTSFIIKGKVGHLSAPAKAYLIGDGKRDSANISNGVFTFKGTIDMPASVSLIVNKKGTGLEGDYNEIDLYLEDGTITVNSPDSIENAKVTGGPLNRDFLKLQLALAPVKAKIDSYNKEYGAATAEQRNSKDFNERVNSIVKEQKDAYLAFIKANPNSQVSLYALRGYAGAFPDLTEVEGIFDLLSNDVRSSKRGVLYAASLEKMKRILIGALAPDFTQTDTAGMPVSLHDYKGKYVLIDFWASWCGPCRAENPNVLKAYSMYHNKGFNVLGVSLDQEKDKWLKAIHDDHLVWTQVSDLKSWNNEVADLYFVHAVPQNFLIGPDGKIVGKNLKGDALNNKLKEIFGD